MFKSHIGGGCPTPPVYLDKTSTTGIFATVPLGTSASRASTPVGHGQFQFCAEQPPCAPGATGKTNGDGLSEFAFAETTAAGDSTPRGHGHYSFYGQQPPSAADDADDCGRSARARLRTPSPVCFHRAFDSGTFPCQQPPLTNGDSAQTSSKASASAAPEFQRESAPMQPGTIVKPTPTDEICKAVKVVDDFRVEEAEEEDNTAMDKGEPSRGSQGHPHSCNQPCKYNWKRRGCRDGANCDHCHFCRWRPSVNRLLRKRTLRAKSSSGEPQPLCALGDVDKVTEMDFDEAADNDVGKANDNDPVTAKEIAVDSAIGNGLGEPAFAQTTASGDSTPRGHGQYQLVSQQPPGESDDDDSYSGSAWARMRTPSPECFHRGLDSGSLRCRHAPLPDGRAVPAWSSILASVPTFVLKPQREVVQMQPATIVKPSADVKVPCSDMGMDVPPPPPPVIMATSPVNRMQVVTFVDDHRVQGTVDKDCAVKDTGDSSRGSQGHPHSCNEPCKYNWKRKGCRDGANCDHCHFCRWRPSVDRLLRKQALRAQRSVGDPQVRPLAPKEAVGFADWASSDALDRLVITQNGYIPAYCFR